MERSVGAAPWSDVTRWGDRCVKDGTMMVKTAPAVSRGIVFACHCHRVRLDRGTLMSDVFSIRGVVLSLIHI